MGGIDCAVEAGQALQGHDRHRCDLSFDRNRGGAPLVLRRHREQGVLCCDPLLLLRPSACRHRRGDVVAARSQRLLHAVQNPTDKVTCRQGVLCPPPRVHMGSRFWVARHFGEGGQGADEEGLGEGEAGGRSAPHRARIRRQVDADTRQRLPRASPSAHDDAERHRVRDASCASTTSFSCSHSLIARAQAMTGFGGF